jgi:arsenite-transporting ATPase
MRIILYTGKGGVGKTSVAAATALRCAELGYRTIVLSTDAAHSLADSFDLALAAEPKEIKPNLWGQEVDVYYQMAKYWSTVQGYMTEVFAWRGLDDVVAEEMTAFPGMEELASLLEIVFHHDSGRYDVIIIDAAPTGETLKLLTFPEVARWWLEKIFPIQRRAAQLLRPMAQPLLNIPLPSDEFFGAIKDGAQQLTRMHDLLSDPAKSTIRLVLNPEKMVIKEAQRTYTYLNLYDYPVDLVISNRIIPTDIQDAYFTSWKEIQARYGLAVEEAFSPLPIRKIPLFDQEVVGEAMLRAMAQAVFGDDDPTRIFFQGKAHNIAKSDGGYTLTVPLPLVSKEAVDLTRIQDELVIRIGNFRRNLILPRALMPLPVTEARLEANELRLRFGPEGNEQQ